MVSDQNVSEKSEEQDDDIQVINESEPDVITYSKELVVNLYNFVGGKHTNLTVPYSTIKIAKKAREMGFRQVTYELFSRPDKSSHLRSMLDLWGFRSYVNYLYTVCELGFLEGLVPVVDFGFLSPDEIKELHDVVALFKLQLFSDYDYVMNKYDLRPADRSANIRLKSLEWVNKLGYANSAGFFAYSGQEKAQWKEWLEFIANLDQTYNVIHEVSISTVSRTEDMKEKPLTLKEMRNLYTMARNIIPDGTPIVFPNASLDMQKFLISEGVTDLSTVFTDNSEENDVKYQEIIDFSGKNNKNLLRRFPIRKQFIQEEKYSKKLGQVFDSYKYKIKKQLQEKQKEAKQ